MDRERELERSPAAAVTLYRGKFNCYETRETLCWSLRIITKHLGYHYVSFQIKDILFRDSGQMYLCIHSSPFMRVVGVLMTHNDLYLSSIYPSFPPSSAVMKNTDHSLVPIVTSSSSVHESQLNCPVKTGRETGTHQLMDTVILLSITI